MKKQPLKKIVKEEMNPEDVKKMNEDIKSASDMIRKKAMDIQPGSILYHLEQAAKGKYGTNQAAKERADKLIVHWTNFFSDTGPIGDLIRLASQQ